MKSPGFGETSAGPQAPGSVTFLFLLAACGGEGAALCGQHFWKRAVGLKRASHLRFWAVAVRRNSSLAPFGPLRRKRLRRRIRLRCANSISTFFRRRQASTYCGVRTGYVASIFVQIPRDLAGESIRTALRFEFADVAIQFAGAINPCPLGCDAASGGRVGSPELN